MAVDALILGDRIRISRQRLDWSQRSLARTSGLPVAAIMRLETGTRAAKVPELVRIAAALGTTLGNLTADSPVRARLVCLSRPANDEVAAQMWNQLAYYLEVDAYLDDWGIAAT